MEDGGAAGFPIMQGHDLIELCGKNERNTGIYHIPKLRVDSLYSLVQVLFN